MFLDGFRYDYLDAENAPFLYDKKRECTCLPLQTLLGFSSSIKAALWTSTYPRTHGYWTYWGHVPHIRKDPPQLYKIFEPIPSTNLRTFSRQVMRYVLNRMGSSATEWFMASVPDDIMPLFSRLSPEISSDDEINGIGTLFGILREKGIECRYITARDYSVPRLEFDSQSNSFNVMFIPNFDWIGHRYGPFSDEIKFEVRKLDTLMEKTVERYSNVKDFHILMFSDHGMAKVEGKVNVKEVIDRLPLRQPMDYLVFYDSTLARFWFFSKKAEKMIVNELESIDNGMVLTEMDKKRFGIDFEHNWYGDAYFLVKAGFEIFPNYFVSYVPRFLEHVLTRKGMHGYDPSEPSQYGIFFHLGNVIDGLSGFESFKLVDIAPFVLKLFGIKRPSYFESDLKF
jgi:predicted AlkP superfamily pyrophosphatase or phosphodiesterase